MQTNININQPLITHSILLVDQLYNQTHQHLSINVNTVLCYCFTKILLAIILVTLPNLSTQQEWLWLIIFIPISTLQLIYNCFVKRTLKNRSLFLSLAQKSGHATYYPSTQISNHQIQTNIHSTICDYQNRQITQINNYDIKIYSYKLKYQILKHNSFTNLGGKIIFLFNTILNIYALIIISNTLKSASITTVSILCILILTTYQYLQIYLIFIILIISIPIYLITITIQNIIKSKHRSNLALNLNSVTFDPLSLRGDHSCHICLQDYQQGQILSILNCNPMHHFHRTCLTQWLQLGQKCPLCRSQIIL